MLTRITIGCPLLLTVLLTACGGGASADATSGATPQVASARAGATAADVLNPTASGGPIWGGASPHSVQLEHVARPARTDQDIPQDGAAADRELATALARYQELLASQAEYQGDQSRWRAEDNYARAKGSTNAAMGVRTPTPRPPDPRLKLAVTRAREAFDAEYGRLSAENKQRCDAQVSALAERTRTSRGARSH